MTTSTQTASYKGRTYRLLWIGATKYGRRAKLGFWDGSKEFWADASAVSVSEARSSGRSASGECQCGACDDLLSFGYRAGQRVRCDECGGWAEAC
jgi:hypothetical protein